MMPPQKSKERLKAYELYKEYGGTRTLKDIAAELNVPDSRVRKWKALDKWDSGALPNAKGSAPKKKRRRGAPKGSKNAKGHGAPLGNKNNFKHGAYEQVFWDFLDEEEQRMLAAMQMDEEEALLVDEIKLLTVRERRLLKRIDEQRSAKGGLALESVVSRKLEIEGNIVHGESQKQTETTTRTISTFEVIAKLDAELTRVQGRKARCIEALSKIRTAKGGASKEAAEWIAAMMELEEEQGEC